MFMTLSVDHRLLKMNKTGNPIDKAEILKWVWGPLDFDRLVILSLIIQFILFFGAPFRKFTVNCVVQCLVWSTYLLADWLSYYAIVLLVSAEAGPDKIHLHVIWGSLLIAHMSGPDNISILDLEDNKLWSRTALKFGTIFYSIARVSIKTFTDHKAMPLFGIATALYIVAVIKSLEKIATLIFSRTVVIQDRVIRKTGANPSNSKIENGAVLVQTDNKLSIKRKEKLSQYNALRDAYRFFQAFQGSYADFKIGFEDAGRSIREYFLERTAEEAFQVIEMELNFVYDTFYTKASNFRLLAIRFVRYFTVIVEVVSFACFVNSVLMDGARWDGSITYMLILGALFMDSIATLQIIFSVRTIVQAVDDRFSKWLQKHLEMLKQPSGDDDNEIIFRKWILSKLLNIRRRTWGKKSNTTKITYPQRVKRMFFRRWSECISQFNFIDYCLRRQPGQLQKVYSILGLKEMINRATYVSHVWFTDSLRDFIFKELESKANLLSSHEADQNLDSMLSGFYAKWIVGREFDQCLLVWHIATELCWTQSESTDNFRDWSKTLSDYMLYLLIQNPKILKQPEVGLMGKIRLEDACEKAEFPPDSISWFQWRIGSKPHDAARRTLSDRLKMSFKRDDETDDVLHEGYQLAEQLKEMGGKEWETISKVWVELLCQAAAESKPTAHIRTLNKGGELITIVWLLMSHLGIDNWGKRLKTPTT